MKPSSFLSELCSKALKFGQFQERKDIYINSLLLTALRVLQRLSGLITTYFIVRSLSQDDFGFYNFAISLVSLLSFFSLGELKNALMQSIARGNYSAYKAKLLISFYASLIGTLIIAGVALWYYFQGNPFYCYGLLVAAVLFPFRNAFNFWKSVQVGSSDFWGLLKQESAVAILTTIAMVSVSVLYPGELLYPVIIYFLFPSLQNLILTVLDLRHYDKKDELQKGEEGSIEYGIKASLVSGVGLLANHIDKLILFAFISPASLAIFVAANQFAELFRNLVKDMAVVLAPKFATKESYTVNLNKILCLFSLVAGLGFIVFAFTFLPWLITIIFGEKYISAIPYAQALMCSVAIGNFATMQFRFIRSKLDTVGFRNVTIGTAAIKIIASIIMIPLYGITGAVISAFLYRIGTAVIVHLVIRKNYLNKE